MELLNLLLFTMLSQREKQPKTKTGYFAQRKAQRLEMKRKREKQYNRYAEIIIELNELYTLRHCKPLFNHDLKRIRFCVGNKVADRMIDRIETVKDTAYNEMIE